MTLTATCCSEHVGVCGFDMLDMRTPLSQRFSIGVVTDLLAYFSLMSRGPGCMHVTHYVVLCHPYVNIIYIFSIFS